MICGEKVREKCKKYWKSQGISQEEKSGNPDVTWPRKEQIVRHLTIQNKYRNGSHVAQLYSN